MEKILSICIPTFNRSHYLKDLLSNIDEQLKKYELFEYVEILVSDNCSEDSTFEVAQLYLPTITYVRNEENIGPDANFLQLFTMAQGNYIWLPGDDDLFREDTINYIIEMIRLHSFDYLYLRISGEELNGKSERDAKSFTNVDLLHRVNIFTTFMTSQVIRASLIKEEIESARVHLGGFMAYYKIFLQALWKSEKCLISGGKEIFANDDNTGGYSFYKVWAVSVFDVFCDSSFSDNKKLFSVMRRRMFFTLLLPITYKLRNGVKGFHFLSENPEISLRKYFGTFFYSNIFKIYLHAPQFLLRSVNFMMKYTSSILKRLDRAIT